MSATWYYGLDSKVHGPVDSHSLQVLFQNGTLKKTDLLLKDGESDWRSAQEWPELQPFFQQRESLVQTSVPLPQFNEKWDSNSYVVLYSKLGSSKLTQDGPFSLEEVKKMLQEKTLSVDDKIWQKHFTDWKSIAELPEFDIYHWKLDSQRQEKLASVVEYEKPIEKPTPAQDDFLARLDRWEADLEPQSQVSFKMPQEKNEEDFLGEAAFALSSSENLPKESVPADANAKGLFVRHGVLTVVSLLGLSAAGFFAFQQYQELQKKAELLATPKPMKNKQVPVPNDSTLSVDASPNPMAPPSPSVSAGESQVKSPSLNSDSETHNTSLNVSVSSPSSTQNPSQAASESSMPIKKDPKLVATSPSTAKVEESVALKSVQKNLPIKLKMETKKNYKEVWIHFQNLPSKTDKIFYTLKGKERSLAFLGGFRKKGSDKVKTTEHFSLQFSSLPLGKYTLIYHGSEVPESEFQMDVGSESKLWKQSMVKLSAQKNKARNQESLLLKEKIQQHLLWVKTMRGLLKTKKSKLAAGKSSLQKLRQGPLIQVEKSVSTLYLDDLWMQLDEISKDLEDLLDGDDLSQNNLQEVQKELLSMLKKLK